jgi:adenylate kinase family enzyme
MRKIIVLTSISGSGKSTYQQALTCYLKIKESVIYTTRVLRHDDVNTVSFFNSPIKFLSVFFKKKKEISIGTVFNNNLYFTLLPSDGNAIIVASADAVYGLIREATSENNKNDYLFVIATSDDVDFYQRVGRSCEFLKNENESNKALLEVVKSKNLKFVDFKLTRENPYLSVANEKASNEIFDFVSKKGRTD